MLPRSLPVPQCSLRHVCCFPPLLFLLLSQARAILCDRSAGVVSFGRLVFGFFFTRAFYRPSSSEEKLWLSSGRLFYGCPLRYPFRCLRHVLRLFRHVYLHPYFSRREL